MELFSQKAELFPDRTVPRPERAAPLPFFMTHPGYTGAGRAVSPVGENVLRDMEYLQQTYPLEVRKIQRRVAEILDKVDYEGSMIYDEYPDRYCLQHLAKTMLQVLKKEEQETDAEAADTEKWSRMEALIQVLLCNEIYKRRHGGRRGHFTAFF